MCVSNNAVIIYEVDFVIIIVIRIVRSTRLS